MTSHPTPLLAAEDVSAAIAGQLGFLAEAQPARISPGSPRSWQETHRDDKQLGRREQGGTVITRFRIQVLNWQGPRPRLVRHECRGATVIAR